MKKNQRQLESIAIQFTDTNNEKTLFLTSSDDTGVRRNGGRNGSRFGPECILNSFKKMNHHLESASPFSIKEIAHQSNTVNSFEEAQDISAKNCLETLRNTTAKNLVHIGGGHDHAYVLLKAMQENSKIDNIVILNIDAHCDTRIDNIHHSGTPFRDFDSINNKETFLIQYGIHLFANGKSTLEKLDNITEKHYLFNDIIEDEDFISQLFNSTPFPITKNTMIYLSLDCDAIESSIMSAVSAVNHQGLSLNHIHKLIQFVKKQNAQKIFGIYEYNPIFDDLSQKGSRSIAGLIYQWLS